MAWKRQTKEEKERLRRRRRRQLIGGVLSILIVVGLVTVLGGTVKSVSRLFDDSKEKESYEKLLTPLVMLDPVPFASLDAADPALLLQAAIWSTIYTEDLSKYDRDDIGALILPSVDVDKASVRLFGSGYKLTHQTFEASGMIFQYDEENKSYLIPITGTTNTYTPQVEKISSSVKQKIVTVGYLAPATGFSLDGATTDANLPVKYYDYVFARQDDSYYLTAITESEMKPEHETAASSAAVVEPEALTKEILDTAAAQAAPTESAEAAAPAA